jgi:predicted nucleotidyltransferase
MDEYKITREQIVDTLVKALKPLDYVCAAWQAGAAAFGRVDEWSDIDFYVVVEDEHVEDVFKVFEESVESVSPIELRYRMPEPTWHGHSQEFIRLKGTSPFLFLDIAVMKRSSKDKFLQFKIHGKPLVHFDKIGVVKDDPTDIGEFIKRIEKRIEILKTNFRLFQVLTLKELNRGNILTALSFYSGYTFRPLVEVLRMKYCPERFNFYTSYVHYDLPLDISARLEKLCCGADSDVLRANHTKVGEWFWEEIETIDLKEIRKRLETVGEGE